MTEKQIRQFINALKKSPDRDDLFNPWWQSDIEHDIGPSAPGIRRNQLFQYLIERTDKARYMILGEALGYQGGHFTGMAMTSERLLLGGLKEKGIMPGHVFKDKLPKRTSRPEIREKGFSEPTATIVWGHIIDSGKDPFEFIIWNAYPWHPFNRKKGKLSNRTPERTEFEDSAHILKMLIDISGIEKIIALGNKAFEQLLSIGIEVEKVRHPANGGAVKFRTQFSRIFG